jgi:hypothetical protein
MEVELRDVPPQRLSHHRPCTPGHGAATEVTGSSSLTCSARDLFAGSVSI